MESNDYTGTTACYVKMDGYDCILTCNHVFVSCDGNGGDSALESGDVFGHVYEYSKIEDWAVIQLDSDEGPGDWIKDSFYGNRTVTGYYTEDGVKNLYSQRIPVYKQGHATGSTEAPISDRNETISTHCVEHYKALRIGTNCAKGDSGGPYYCDGDGTQHESGVSMVGVHQASKSTDPECGTVCGDRTVWEYSYGFPAHELANIMDFTVSTDTCGESGCLG